MKSTVIVALVAFIAIGGAFSAFAANRTVETTVDLEMQFWVSVTSSSAFVSTRQEGEEWVTHDFHVDLRPHAVSSRLLVSEPVTLSVPVRVEVESEEVVVDEPLTPLSPAIQLHGAASEAPSGEARCCTVRGMRDERAAQRRVARDMRAVIAEVGERVGLTHQGSITLNIAHTPGGLLLRYEEAFGEELAELPNDCSFQRGEHLFLGPGCRGDRTALARAYVVRATEALYVPARWVGVATFEYYWHWYRFGEPPTGRDDRYRSAIFHQEATDFRAGRGHDDLMGAAALFAMETYGTFEDWLGFYEEVRAGGEVHTAFRDAFGVTLLRFYQDFEAWAPRERENMLALAYGSCREAARYLEPRPFQEGGGFPDYRVPLEYDGDGDGYVCEEYAQFREEEVSCLIVGEVEEGEE